MGLTGYHKENFTNSMTVDRKIPKVGYKINNLVLSRSIVNRSKQNMTIPEFVNFCKMIVKNAKNRFFNVEE
jgi:hypothetical protein